MSDARASFDTWGDLAVTDLDRSEGHVPPGHIPPWQPAAGPPPTTAPYWSINAQQQHPPYGPLTGVPPQTPKASNGLATAGFVVSAIGAGLALIPFLGLVSWLICPVGFVLSLIGLGLSVNRDVGRGYAISGVLLAGAGIIVCAIYTAAFTNGFSTPMSTTSATDDSAATTGQYSAGTYAVGQDITPGTYTTPGSSNCYWARLRGNSGDLNDINANDIVDGQSSMSVQPSDRFVKFDGTCTWTRR